MVLVKLHMYLVVDLSIQIHTKKDEITTYKLITLMCLSIWTHKKKINFPFETNGKFIIFRCPKIWAHYSLIIMCLNIRTPNIHHFPFWTNEKEVVLGVPVFKHFGVCEDFLNMHCGMAGIIVL